MIRETDPQEEEDRESLSLFGGRLPLILLGIVLPVLIGALVVRGWIREEAVWLAGSRDGGVSANDLVIRGPGARNVLVSYLGIGAFLHFRWLWDELSFGRIAAAGMIIGTCMMVGGCGSAFYRLMA